MKLSNYFSLAEMTASQTAERRGIANVPDEEAIASLKSLCQHVLDKVREHYGVSIQPSSGYRSPRLNVAIGGVPSSQHCKGEAVDFTVPGVPVADVCKWICSNLLFDQCIQEFTSNGGGWVHVSYKRKGGNRKKFLKIG